MFGRGLSFLIDNEKRQLSIQWVKLVRLNTGTRSHSNGLGLFFTDRDECGVCSKQLPALIDQESQIFF
jgi:predicted glutamine amidotransferase